MTQPETEIRRAWRHIAGPHHDAYVDALLIRYGEPHRRYHNATHVMLVLRHLHDMAPAPSAALLAAALYHDAIYDPRHSDSEANSATLAVADLTEVGWAHLPCSAVRSLILATSHLTEASGGSQIAGDAADAADRAMLLDADIAILGAEPGAYQAYVNGVRAEYAHVDDERWRTGRTEVLQRFLDRRRLYATEIMHAAREHRARANIEAELAALL